MRPTGASSPMESIDQVALRACGLEDAEALALVAAATFLEAFAGILPGPAIVQHCARHHVPRVYAKYLSGDRVRAWLAVMREGGAPVGYSMLTPPDLPLPDLVPSDIELKRIYLFSKFQGSGLGQQMMDAAIEAAHEMGARRLLLGVYAHNLRALRFYKRYGFAQVGTRTFTVGTLVCDDLVLGRSL